MKCFHKLTWHSTIPAVQCKIKHMVVKCQLSRLCKQSTCITHCISHKNHVLWKTTQTVNSDIYDKNYKYRNTHTHIYIKYIKQQLQNDNWQQCIYRNICTADWNTSNCSPLVDVNSNSITLSTEGILSYNVQNDCIQHHTCILVLDESIQLVLLQICTKNRH